MAELTPKEQMPVADALRLEVTEAAQIVGEIEGIYGILFCGLDVNASDQPRQFHIEGMVSDLSEEHHRARSLLQEIVRRLQSRAQGIEATTQAGAARSVTGYATQAP